MKILKKISVKTVIGHKIDPEKLAEGRDIALVEIIGIVVGVRTTTSTYGTSICFKGSFEATNIETGETFRSGEMYLPSVAESVLYGAIKNVENPMVNIGIKIGVIKSDSSPVGYEYTCETMGNEDVDPLQSVRAALGLQAKHTKPALPGKKKTNQLEAPVGFDDDDSSSYE